MIYLYFFILTPLRFDLSESRSLLKLYCQIAFQLNKLLNYVAMPGTLDLGFYLRLAFVVTAFINSNGNRQASILLKL